MKQWTKDIVISNFLLPILYGPYTMIWGWSWRCRQMNLRVNEVPIIINSNSLVSWMSGSKATESNLETSTWFFASSTLTRFWFHCACYLWETTIPARNDHYYGRFPMIVRIFHGEEKFGKSKWKIDTISVHSWRLAIWKVFESVAGRSLKGLVIPFQSHI